VRDEIDEIVISEILLHIDEVEVVEHEQMVLRDEVDDELLIELLIDVDVYDNDMMVELTVDELKTL
jgi:hypothetical protein